MKMGLCLVLLVPGLSVGDEKEVLRKNETVDLKNSTIKISNEPRVIDPIDIYPKVLTQKVTGKFDDMPLYEFVEWLQKTLKHEVQLDKDALEDAGIAVNGLISGSATNEPVYQLLSRVLRNLPKPMTCYVEDDILFITTRTGCEERT